MRVKGGYSTRVRRKSVLKKASGYWGHRSNSYRTARQSIIKAAQYAFRDRKSKKRVLRRLWITRINAAVRGHGITYSVFMKNLKAKKISLNRKTLSEMAIHDPGAFKDLC